jgi:hypothetical protein
MRVSSHILQWIPAYAGMTARYLYACHTRACGYPWTPVFDFVALTGAGMTKSILNRMLSIF